MSSERPAPDRSRTAVFTIVSKNYLHFARTLMGSIAATHPEWERIVLLADRSEQYFDPRNESFETVNVADLEIPDAKQLFFRYNIVELNTAVKPWCFRFLLQKGFSRVLYLDPDIYVYARLEDVSRAWNAGAMTVLTPHLTGRIRDTLRPSERDILLAGSYNLGFLGVAQHEDLAIFLDFWCEKSLRDFVADVRAGLFTDQRWMDLVPGMFRDTHILRHEGYNVAYWNLPHRHLRRLNGSYAVNGQSLVFFHFSGIDPARPESFSKHQNRYRLADVGLVSELVREYCRAVSANNFDRCSDWPYAYDYFDDGTKIPPDVRRLYNVSPDFAALGGSDPFALHGDSLNHNCDTKDPPVTWRMRAIHHVRLDLQRAFPDPLGHDRLEFCQWFVENAGAVPELPSTTAAQSVKDGLRQSAVETHAGETSGAKPFGEKYKRLLPPVEVLSWSFLDEAARKALRAAREGRLSWSPLRWVQLLRLQAAEAAQQRIEQSVAPLLERDLSIPITASQAAVEKDDHARPASTLRHGMNVVGYLADGTGVAQTAHAGAAACEAAGIPFRLTDARPLQPEPANFAVNLLFVNADQTPIVCDLLGDEFFADRHTIAVWTWELSELPDQYLPSFARIDEVWAPSQFVMRCVAEKSPIPVVHMPYCVTLTVCAEASRASFGLPKDTFIFLMMYDMLSIQERKNPIGAFDAFSRAFPDPDGVRLVIRVNHASACPENLAQLRECVAGRPGVIVLDGPFSREEVIGLHAACDAFVSLHRSEGFGLNLAESMLLGKPVIATNWSGNVDFMDRHNSCPVDFTLVPLDKDYGPYRKGNIWADPDLDQAAWYMRSLVENPELRRAIGERAKASIATNYSPVAIGNRYRRRLQAIERFSGTS